MKKFLLLFLIVPLSLLSQSFEFLQIKVNEASMKKDYEKFHKVTFEEGVEETIIFLADRYMPTKKFPDKAIDILDETASYVRQKKKEAMQSSKTFDYNIKKALKIIDQSNIKNFIKNRF